MEDDGGGPGGRGQHVRISKENMQFAKPAGQF